MSTREPDGNTVLGCEICGEPGTLVRYGDQWVHARCMEPDDEPDPWCDRCSPERCTCLDDDPDAREDYPGEGWATDPICFCGSSFSDHDEGSSHSPVEMYDDGVLQPPRAPLPDDEVF